MSVDGLVEGERVVLLRLDRLQPLHVRMAGRLIGLHLGDPARLVRRGEGRGDDGEGAVLADLRRHRVDHRLADAVELGLVHEPLAGIRLRVGVVADHVDAGCERLLQHRRDGDRVVGGEQDAVHALRDVVVDEGDLLVDIGFRRAVGGDGDVAELGRRFRLALGRGGEIADADQLRHVDDGDRLAVQIRRVGRLAAVIGLRGDLARPAVAGERIGRQVVSALPHVLRQRRGGEYAREERHTQQSQHFSSSRCKLIFAPEARCPQPSLPRRC